MVTRHLTRATLLTLILVGGLPLHAQEGANAIPETEIETAPVILDGAVLFRLRGASSLPAATRAALVASRLTEAAGNSTVAMATIRLQDDGEVTRILAGETALLTILDADAALEQLPRSQLAAAHLARIRQAVAAYREARAPAALRRATINAAAATLVLIIAVAGAWWLRRWLERLLTRRWQARIHTVGIQSFEVMRAERIWDTLRRGLLTLQTVACLALSFAYLSFVLAQFPWTRGSARSMVGLAVRPIEVIAAGIVAHIPSLVFLTVLYYVIRVVLRLLRLFFEAVERGRVTLGGFDADWAQPTYKIVRLAVVAFALIVAYPYIPGSDSAAFRGVSLFIGVVFSLGSSAAISNIIAGYMMTYRRAFKVGDRIKVGDAIGDVIEMRLQVTHLRSPKNEEIVLPNSQILAGEVRNYSSLARTSGLILHTQVGIGYETPWRQVEAMLLEAAERTTALAREPAPFVLEKALGDFAVTYELNVYCRRVSEMYQLYAELHRQILDVFNEYGVQIMTPAYEGDPATPKVVLEQDWYPAPAQRPATAADTASRSYAATE